MGREDPLREGEATLHRSKTLIHCHPGEIAYDTALELCRSHGVLVLFELETYNLEGRPVVPTDFFPFFIRVLILFKRRRIYLNVHRPTNIFSTYK
jgi:hypothetical protein